MPQPRNPEISRETCNVKVKHFLMSQSSNRIKIESFKSSPDKPSLSNVLISLAVFIIKIPFYIFFFGISYSYMVISKFIPNKKVSRIITRINSVFCFKILQILMGNMYTPIIPTPLIDSYMDAQQFEFPKPGDLIISNFSSYLNLFFLQKSFSPIFAIPNDETTVFLYSFYDLFLNIIMSKTLIKKNSQSLEYALQYAKNQHCPLVIFPEAVPTNGQCVIKFKPFGKGLDTQNLKVYIIGFNHKSPGISPHFTIGNGYFHMFLMIGQVYSGLKMKAALPNDIPIMENGITTEWIENCRSILARIMRVPLSEDSYIDFLNTYDNVKPHND